MGLCRLEQTQDVANDLVDNLSRARNNDQEAAENFLADVDWVNGPGDNMACGGAVESRRQRMEDLSQMLPEEVGSVVTDDASGKQYLEIPPSVLQSVRDVAKGPEVR